MKTYKIYASHQVYYVKEVQAETWEDETSEDNRRDAIDRLKEYRLNMPQYAHRLVKTRERLEV